jgi:hypothetical protein
MHVLHGKRWKLRFVFFAFGGGDRDRVFGDRVFGDRVFGDRVFGDRVFGDRDRDCVFGGWDRDRDRDCGFGDRDFIFYDAMSGLIESSNSCRSHDHLNRMWSLF